MPPRKRSPSMAGDNCYSLSCGPTGRTVNYAVCQHTVWAFKEGRLKGFEDCNAALKERSCPAVQMMLKEKADRAIYIESYQALIDARLRQQQERIDRAENNQRRDRIMRSTAKTPAEDLAATDQAVVERLSMQDDTVQKRIARNRQSRKVTSRPQANDNMFAEIVNDMLSEKPS